MNERDNDELDRLAADFLQAVEAGRNPDPAEWLARHPAHAAGLATFFADLGRFGSFLGLPAGPTLDETVDHRAAGEGRVDAGRFGDYELLGEVGRGSMGVVYRARLAGTNLVVALKQVRPGGLDGAAKRFREEVENASGLRHPHIVPIFHVGEHTGRPFYTMALIEGGSLDKHLPRFLANPRLTATLVAKVARAVHHAHQRRVLHRDLKPGNVLLDETGEPHVADFGLATRLDEDGATTVGAPAGSLPWMAPEAVRAEGALTTAVDVWALGVILYELLTGARPFDGTDRNAIRQAILDTDPRPPRAVNPALDRDLEAICLKCLSKDPDRRYESASALALDLDRWLRDEPVRARRARPVERLVKWSRRHPALAGAVAFAGLLVVASVIAAISVAGAQESRLREEVCEGNEYAARNVAVTVLGRLREYGDMVQAASNREELYRLIAIADPAERKRAMQEWLASAFPRPPSGPFATVFILDPGGIIRAELPANDRVIDHDFRHRDYFRGAQARAARHGRDRVHYSKVFPSVNDGLDKLAVSVAFPPGKADQCWLLGATIPTDATLGIGDRLHDDRRKAVLVAPRDRGPSSDPEEYAVLVHPGYEAREPAIAFPAAWLRPYEDRYLPEDNYYDPVAAQHPAYRGRWLAGFAAVPDTQLVVVVQQPYDEAVAPYQAFFRRFVEWVAAAAGVAGLVIVGVWLTRHRRHGRR